MSLKAKAQENQGPQDQKTKSMGGYLWKILPYAAKYKVRIGTGLVLNSLARFFDLLPMVLIGRVVDIIATTSGSPPFETFLLYGAAILGTFAGLAVFQSSSNYALDSMAQKVRHDLRMAIYGHMQRLDASFFEERQTGDLLAVVSNDVDNLENFFSDVTTSVVRLVITFTGIYGFLLWLDWRLALLLMAPLPFAVAAVRFFAIRVQPQYRRARKAVGEINSILENNIRGIDVIQAFTAEKEQQHLVGQRSLNYTEAAVNAARERAKFIPLIYLIAGCAFGLLITVGAWMTISLQGPSMGDYTTFVLFALRLVLPLFVFGMLINQIQRSEASARRIVQLLSLQPTIVDKRDAVPMKSAPHSISFENVSFSYLPGRPVLKNINCTLEQGHVLAVVGPTGAGKSTLIKLLLRYYDPEAGKVLVDNRPLPDVRLADYRSHIGYVSQDAFLFFGTVTENIRLGSPRAGEKDVQRAAEIAGANEFIRELPRGYETMIGERGMKLSGGQRQRISLARAVLRNPALLVLDEATSAVDTRTEEVIQENLHRFKEGRMTVAVAHRLSTIRHSDEIVVLVDGLVAERGDHDALLDQGGVYAGLWRVQSGERAAQEKNVFP